MARDSKRSRARTAQLQQRRVARQRQRHMPRLSKRSDLKRRRGRERQGWAAEHFARRRRPHRRGGKSPIAFGAINLRPRKAPGSKLFTGIAGPSDWEVREGVTGKGSVAPKKRAKGQPVGRTAGEKRRRRKGGADRGSGRRGTGMRPSTVRSKRGYVDRVS